MDSLIFSWLVFRLSWDKFREIYTLELGCTCTFWNPLCIQQIRIQMSGWSKHKSPPGPSELWELLSLQLPDYSLSSLKKFPTHVWPLCLAKDSMGSPNSSVVPSLDSFLPIMQALKFQLLCLSSTQWDCWGSAGVPFRKIAAGGPWQGSHHWFPSLQDDSPELPGAQCLKKIHILSSFWQEVKSGPCYSVMARRWCLKVLLKHCSA